MGGGVENSYYVLQRSFAPHTIPSSTQIIGSDESEGSIVALYYDDRIVSRIYRMSLTNGVWKIWRDSSGFSQRFEGKLSKDRDTITGQWEILCDGTHWELDFDLIYNRIEYMEAMRKSRHLYQLISYLIIIFSHKALIES